MDQERGKAGRQRRRTLEQLEDDASRLLSRVNVPAPVRLAIIIDGHRSALETALLDFEQAQAGQRPRNGS